MHPPGLQRFALTRDGPASAPRADGLRRAYYGPSHARNAMPGPSVAGLRGCAFAGGSAHSRRHRLGASRLCRGAPALEPGGEPAAGERGAALPARAGAGHARPARLRRGRLQVTLLLEPQSTIAREAMDGLAGLQPTSAGDGEVLVPLESGLGVWIVPALVNGHRGRFLLDTGSSVIVVGPTLVGDAVLRGVPVVMHDPGPGVDEILGNTFLSQYLVTSTPIAGNWVSVPSTVMERPPCIRR